MIKNKNALQNMFSQMWAATFLYTFYIIGIATMDAATSAVLQVSRLYSLLISMGVTLVFDQVFNKVAKKHFPNESELALNFIKGIALIGIGGILIVAFKVTFNEDPFGVLTILIALGIFANLISGFFTFFVFRGK